MNYKKAVFSILKFIPIGCLIFIIFFNLYLGINKMITKNAVPKFLGFSTVYVLSGSMEPAIHVGDLLIIKERNPSEYRVRDVITFTQNNIPFTHRIIQISGDDFITQGDANTKADEPISADMIQGEVILAIPKIGSVALFCKTPAGIILMSIILIILLYSGDVYQKIRRKHE